MIAKGPLRVLTPASYPRALCAWLAATLAVLLDLLFRSSDYRDLLPLLPVVGILKFSGVLTLVFLQVVALFYLILLLPRILRTVALLLSVFVLIVQFSYWRTLSQFMTGTDFLLLLTVGGDHRAEAVSSFFQPLVFWYALPYALVLSALILFPRFRLPKDPRPQPPAGALPPRIQLRPLPPRAGTPLPFEPFDLLPPFHTSIRV